ncbi:MAG TPA: T9SS type A sorting domain-containing protein, partial [Bacteroidales bacterium]|nr:T9SS type A sorting domain-containing protein [Bacteroidales bacterium]
TSPTHEYQKADTTYNVCYTIIDPITSDSSTYCEPVEVKKSGVKTATTNNVQYTVYPNPAKDNITAILYIKQATDAKVDICDLSGRTIMNLNSKLKLETGSNSIKFNINNLQYGSYILRFTTSSGDIYKKLIIKY